MDERSLSTLPAGLPAPVDDDATIARVFYPVFPPDRNAADVLAALRSAR